MLAMRGPGRLFSLSSFNGIPFFAAPAATSYCWAATAFMFERVHRCMDGWMDVCVCVFHNGGIIRLLTPGKRTQPVVRAFAGGGGGGGGDGAVGILVALARRFTTKPVPLLRGSRRRNQTAINERIAWADASKSFIRHGIAHSFTHSHSLTLTHYH